MRKMTTARTSTAPATNSFILQFCHHMALRSCFPFFWNCSAWLCSASVLSTRSSIFSPRSRTFSMFSIMTSLTSLTFDHMYAQCQTT